MGDHIHMLLMIISKYSVANTVGFLKREISNTNIPGFYADKTEFHRRELLGAELLCQHSWFR